LGVGKDLEPCVNVICFVKNCKAEVFIGGFDNNVVVRGEITEGGSLVVSEVRTRFPVGVEFRAEFFGERVKYGFNLW
jgi:hypothetical protein